MISTHAFLSASSNQPRGDISVAARPDFQNDGNVMFGSNFLPCNARVVSAALFFSWPQSFHFIKKINVIQTGIIFHRSSIENFEDKTKCVFLSEIILVSYLNSLHVLPVLTFTTNTSSFLFDDRGQSPLRLQAAGSHSFLFLLSASSSSFLCFTTFPCAVLLHCCTFIRTAPESWHRRCFASSA